MNERLAQMFFNLSDTEQLLAARIPGAQVVFLENAGHGFFFEAAKRAGDVITSFLLGRH